MKHTWKYEQGYRYYVYLGPGRIEYYKENEREEAEKYAAKNGAKVEEVF